jgi:DNA-binding NarL/FixJ family response regulator
MTRPRLPGPDGTVLLKDAERELLSHLAKGLTDREIAAAVFRTQWAVTRRLQVIYKHIGVTKRVEAAVWAAKQGLV